MEPGQEKEEKGFLNVVRGAVESVFSTEPKEGDATEEVEAEGEVEGEVEAEAEAEAEAEGEVEAEAEVAPIARKKRTRKPREIKPTDSKSFFEARSKDVSRFKFTSDGNLQIPPIGGEEAKVLTLPYYSESSPEERQAIDTKRHEDILTVEREYDELSRQLYTAIEEWKSSGDYIDAIRLQKELLALDSRRTTLRTPLRWGKLMNNPTIKDVQLHETAVVDEKNQDLKLGYDVMSLIGRSYTFEQEVRVRDSKPVAEEAEAEAEADTIVESFVLFGSPQDPEYGLLSPETPVEFVFNTTKYTSILQAYYVERATQVGRSDIRATLLKLANPKTIRSVGSRIVGKEKKEVDMPLELLTDIVKSLVLQDARFTPLLRKTGLDTLVYAEPADKVLGVGLSVSDDASNTTRWNGAQNLLGKAWQAVRKTLPAEEEAVQSGGVVLESGKTVQDGKAVRANILKGYYRRKA